MKKKLYTKKNKRKTLKKNSLRGGMDDADDLELVFDEDDDELISTSE